MADTKRTCFYVDETMRTPNGYVPALVTEDEPGYSPMMGQGDLSQPWYWGHDLETARKIAAESNAKRGITPEDAEEIVLSSIVASNRASAAAERWERIKSGEAELPSILRLGRDD